MQNATHSLYTSTALGDESDIDDDDDETNNDIRNDISTI